MYTQNDEELHIANYFRGQKGNLLSIGENDGRTFSNALALIELGWKAVLVEPSPAAFELLKLKHMSNTNVTLVNAAIGPDDSDVVLHQSGAHVPNGRDVALVSTIKESETKRWKRGGVMFEKVTVKQITYNTLLREYNVPVFDFISIDAEGMDFEILKQIDLNRCSMLCIEWNGDWVLNDRIKEYCAKFGMNRLITRNTENIILAR